MEKKDLTQEEIVTLKVLVKTIQKGIDAGLIEGVSTTSKSNQNAFFNADELAKYLGISIKTVYYRSAPKSANPFPFKVLRVGGSKRGRLRFKKSDVEAAIREGVI